MEKLIVVEHLHQNLKSIYFHNIGDGFNMEFIAATAQEARSIRNGFNAFMVHAPSNMNFSLEDVLCDKVKAGEFGFGAVRISGNIPTALNFLKVRRLITEEIYRLILDDKDLTSFLTASGLYKSDIEELISDDEESVVEDVTTLSQDMKSDVINKNNSNASNNEKKSRETFSIFEKSKQSTSPSINNKNPIQKQGTDLSITNTNKPSSPSSVKLK